jgi:hypothetical protein
MSRSLTSASTLENLKREAKRRLRALHAHDGDARARPERVTPGAPAQPTLRDVQLALAREHGLAGWTDLKREVGRIERDCSRTAARCGASNSCEGKIRR